MATRRIVTTTDDLDGSDGARTVRFSLQDDRYEIDLSEHNLAQLRALLEPYATAGRRLSRSGRPYVRTDLDEHVRVRRRT